ncbi:putative amidase [Vitis vinifera]|uniref:Putative amidase n=1 Tax=Vitis vinifera TaxID=29760 RepID=A0A438IJ04_VITVI|nr:putative amidase [Vitis vinifera]
MPVSRDKIEGLHRCHPNFTPTRQCRMFLYHRPICWSVLDAVYVLDAIVGFDPRDGEATKEASKFIPVGGYKQFLNKDGIAGKRLGVVRNPFSGFYNRSTAISAFEAHLTVLRQRGAILVDNLEIENVDIILNPYESGESTALLAEFKLNINEYLKELTHSPVSRDDKWDWEAREDGNGNDGKSVSGWVEKLMMENKLDATVALGSGMATVLAIGGYPGVSVPAGYDGDGMPFGICFGGLKGMEPKLIEVAYGFEQATKIRRPPTSPNNLLCPNEPL